ncbi:MAG: 4-hydroxythreonine-4-phosphate dehydrogenase, partial [Gemmatimonadota bacterium]
MTRRVRLAVTLGDPRGIGPEIVAAALAAGVDADITLIGAKDQISSIPAAHHHPTGPWRPDSGPVRASAVEAGLITGRAIERAAKLALDGEVDA